MNQNSVICLKYFQKHILVDSLALIINSKICLCKLTHMDVVNAPSISVIQVYHLCSAKLENTTFVSHLDRLI